jgi:hypothetical protein
MVLDSRFGIGELPLPTTNSAIIDALWLLLIQQHDPNSEVICDCDVCTENCFLFLYI